MVNEPSVFEPLKFYCKYSNRLICAVIIRDLLFMFQMILSDIPHQRLYITEDTGLSWKTVRPSFSPYRLILSPSNQSWVLGYNLLEMKVGKSCMSKAQLDFVFTEEQITAKIKNKCLPYKFYVLGQIGLSKQCRPRSDCF